MSKVFERPFKQIKKFLSTKLLYGFRKKCNAQYSSIYMLEKWKSTLDKCKYVDVIFTALKAFDTINHNLLRATLHEKCPNTELFLDRIFLYSARIQENTDQKKLRIWTLFTQCFGRIYGHIMYNFSVSLIALKYMHGLF